MDVAAPVLFVVFLWWFSTGAILLVDGLPAARAPWIAIAGSFAAVLALIYGAFLAGDTSVAAAYLSFGAALVCWGWQELTLYSGLITGPRRIHADPGASGTRRFVQATQAILYHEIAIAVLGLVMIWVAFGQPNQVGVWTYMILWWMRLSAKMNIFLGVPNHSAEFLPGHIAYLQSYFRNRPMNLLFPVSVTISTVVTVWLYALAAGAPAGSHEQAGYLILATLMALAVIEHWFLVIPLPATKLWTWGLAGRSETGQNGTETDETIGGGRRAVEIASKRVAIPQAKPIALGRHD